MRYVANLIPEKSKVLPQYFTGNQYEPARKRPWRNALLWILGCSLLLAALLSIRHPWLLLLYGSTGFMLLPPGHRWIERKLRFKLTTKIKTVACTILLLLALPLSSHYAGVAQQTALQQTLLDEQAAKQKAIADRKDAQRKDSLDYYIGQSRALSSQRKMEQARAQLQRAVTFAGAAPDKNRIEKEQVSIDVVQVKDWVKSGKYQKALPEINRLLEADPANAELRYSQALCYSKTGNIQQAVAALKPLMQSGNKDAEKLHEKINPIRKRVVGTETLCCDGTTSYATGRGACSHHGGVCDWNYPIYEEYRKYE